MGGPVGERWGSPSVSAALGAHNSREDRSAAFRELCGVLGMTADESPEARSTD